MESHLIVYENFKSFVKETIPNNYSAGFMCQLEFSTFISYIKKNNNNQPDDEVIAEILAKIGEKKENFKEEHLTKFKRFISYFRKYSEIE